MASADTPPSPRVSPLADLFGLLACIRLLAFERRAADAAQAPYEDEVVLAGLAVGAFAQFERLRDRLIGLGADPWAAIGPFHEAVTAFHDRTRPSDAVEALTKVYVADSVLADIYLEAAAKIDADTRAVTGESLADSGHTALLTERIRAAAAADQRLASRLGLWARRLVGEALSQAHLIESRHASLAALFGDEGVAAVFDRVLDRHQARMRAIELTD